MKVFLVLSAVLVCASAQIKCIQGKDGSKAAENCASAEEKKCSGPFFKEFTGVTTHDYACGACKTGEGVTCKTSDGDSSNKVAEAGEDFKCKDYEWKEKWVVKSTSTVCKRLKTNTKTQCNMPGEKALKETDVGHQNAGCGPCDATKKKNGMCADCDKAECNSAAKVFAFFVPLMAVLYTLL